LCLCRRKYTEETGRSLKKESETFPTLLPEEHLTIKEILENNPFTCNVCEHYKKEKKNGSSLFENRC
jgi:hypothetical protein